MASQLLTPSPLLKVTPLPPTQPPKPKLTPTTIPQPLVTLASWTFIQQLWMHTTRLRAITQHAVSLDPAAFDADLATKVPHATRRVADNYNHLHEQPTVFYAVVLALALAGDRAPARWRPRGRTSGSGSRTRCIRVP
ncbi:MAPEG family [Teratosphaeria destructans]|uniref:MAPEG family n=1 Tax=Teratosphaeria destructans TaxID=418781 RepID=A0A9W7SJG8_9PEZI|nr:MAPEG family [Teratosphaeria destructans]